MDAVVEYLKVIWRTGPKGLRKTTINLTWQTEILTVDISNTKEGC
jgi:hypothetical protein